MPFTSESKEAIADYDEIRKEIKLAMQDCGRKLQGYLNRRKRQKYEGERRSIFERYIGEVELLRRHQAHQQGRAVQAPHRHQHARDRPG